MPPRPVSASEILALLAQKATVLTHSVRAAQSLRRLFHQAQQDAGLSLWEPPKVLDWNSWLNSLHAELIVSGDEDRILLNVAQEHALWRQIVLDDPDHSPLTPEDSLAELAHASYAKASAWKLENQLKASASSHDARVFARWADLFVRHSERKRFLPAAHLPRTLREHLAQHHLPLTKRLYLLGFEDLPPAHKELLDGFSSAGTRVTELAWKPAETQHHATALLPDERHETRFALRWLRKQMLAFPTRSYALLLPDPAAERSELEPLLREILTPELNDVRQPASLLSWEFANGTKLASIPLVADALLLLRWLKSSLPVERISPLLLSPYTALATDLEAAARFDYFVLKAEPLLRPELDLAGTLKIARKHESYDELTQWLHQLAEFTTQMRELPPRRSYAEWSDTAREALRLAGWPGPREQEAHEGEAQSSFDGLLDMLATLDVHQQKVTYTEFLAELQRAAMKVTLTENAEALLKILPVDAVAGLSFDVALFLRATDNHLPRLQRADPLLDRATQHAFRMPGAHAEADLQRAQERFANLRSSITTLLFTSAAETSESKLNPSLWTRALPSLSASSLVPAEEIQEAVELETIADTALPQLPSAYVAGGARVLKLQAACGFLAFAEIRLGGRESRQQSAGFDAIDSGNVLHTALDHFWGKVRTQAELRSFTSAARREALEASVDYSLHRHVNQQTNWDAAYLSIQREQMLSLLSSWLDHELERGPFSVLSSERKELASIGPLELSVRIDRIDRVENTPEVGYVFVDYKTGSSAKPAAWQGDRPDDPQLPLYALLGEANEVRALTFAKLRLGEEMKWEGWQSEEGILPKKGSRLVDLEDQVQQWRSVLQRLSEDFAGGMNPVAPKSFTINCQQCAQRLLCRVDASALMQSAQDEPESGEEYV